MTPDDAALVRWVAGHDEPCPVCSYNLQDAPDAVCPECGVLLRLSVTSPATALGPLILGIVSFSVAIGFDAVTLALVGGSVVLFGPPPGIVPQMTVFFLTLGLLALLSALGLGALVRSRKRWYRQARRRQWEVAWLIFLIVGGIHAIAGVTLISILA
ncbi:MAG: hypothetical protein H6811_07085 [Phycisphaeraceae bacterium]|nr:hypothetical protein [Phycisphaeraceae bacterium]